MPFKSSEIRWFSKEKNDLLDWYNTLPESGAGIQEETRTDYYLRTDSIKTGIKIREGNHEIKVKAAPDESREFGNIEHWIKWSSEENPDILQTIPSDLLTEWIAVEKHRAKKRFEIRRNTTIPSVKEFSEESCEAEFTRIYLPDCEKTFYSVGFEAVSAKSLQRKNLLLTLNYIDVDFSSIKALESFGYPEFLKTVVN